MAVRFLAMASLMSLLGADAPKEGDLAKLQGTWKFTAIQVEGMDLPEQTFKDARMIIKDDTFTMKAFGGDYKGTFKLDPTKKPRTLDIAFTEGPEKGNTSLAIYEVDGDTCRFCLGLTGKPRPTEFASKPGSGHVLETWKREK